MKANTNDQDIPRLKPTPLTWVYIAFAIAVVVLTVWGFATAGVP